MKKLLCAIALLLMAMPTSRATENNSDEIVLSSNNMILLSGEVNSLSVAKVISRALQLDTNSKSNSPIILVLNTPGGSIQAGLELIEALKSLNRPVKTLTIFAASMGFQIVQHLDQRNILRYGILASHKAFGNFEGEFGGDGPSQLDNRYVFWLKRIGQMDEQTVKRTNGKQTLKSYRAAYENELWLTGDESVANGYADRVVSARCDASLSGTHTEDVNFVGGVTFRLKFSNCPLATSPIEILALIHTNLGVVEMGEFLTKGGLMQTECSPSKYNDNYPSRFDRKTGSSVPKQKRQAMCALNKDLTIEKIQAEKEKLRAKYTFNISKHTIMLNP